jgi:uncharacterized integral membrane protein
MRLLLWLVRGLLFVLLLGLAIKNSGEVGLRFFFDAQWQAPLSLVILSVFAVGVVAGLIAMLPTWARQRRQLAKLRASQPAITSPSSRLPKIVDVTASPEP